MIINQKLNSNVIGHGDEMTKSWRFVQMEEVTYLTTLGKVRGL